MSVKVKCYCRVCRHAEPCKMYFDLNMGYVIGLESVMNSVPVKNNFDFDISVEGDPELTDDMFYQIMFQYPDVKICVDYKGIGVVMIQDGSMVMYNCVAGFKGVAVHIENVFRKTTNPVGLVRSPVFTYNALSGVVDLVVFEHEGNLRSLTRFGLCRVEPGLAATLNAKSMVAFKYSELFKYPVEDDDFYGLVAANGEVVPVWLDRKNMVLGGEKL